MKVLHTFEGIWPYEGNEREVTSEDKKVAILEIVEEIATVLDLTYGLTMGEAKVEWNEDATVCTMEVESDTHTYTIA